MFYSFDIIAKVGDILVGTYDDNESKGLLHT